MSFQDAGCCGSQAATQTVTSHSLPGPHLWNQDRSQTPGLGIIPIPSRSPQPGDGGGSRSGGMLLARRAGSASKQASLIPRAFACFLTARGDWSTTQTQLGLCPRGREEAQRMGMRTNAAEHPLCAQAHGIFYLRSLLNPDTLSIDYCLHFGKPRLRGSNLASIS